MAKDWEPVEWTGPHEAVFNQNRVMPHDVSAGSGPRYMNSTRNV
jgi:hypothetical protein